MRLLHTADWHLGRLLHGTSLIEDQQHVLDQLVEIAREARVDGVLLAGDVYDRAVPPPEAIRLLDDVLSRLILGLEIPVVVVAGNHDSPGRLGFASRVLHGQGLHVCAWPEEDPEPIVLRDEHGPVHVVTIPYAEPALVRERLREPGLKDHDACMRALLRRARASLPEDERAVLVAHAFVAGGVPSESERPLAVGGADRIHVGRFRGFDYVALGHLHRPQRVGNGPIHYAGSLLKYSFDEAEHPKSVNVVEIDATGDCRVERVGLSPRREVRCLTGTLRELLAGPGPGESADDYLQVTLTDREPPFDPLGKLRAVYPHVLQLERPFRPASPNPEGMADHRRIDEQVLFERFFAEVTGDRLDEAQKRVFAAAVERMRTAQREAGG